MLTRGDYSAMVADLVVEVRLARGVHHRLRRVEVAESSHRLGLHLLALADLAALEGQVDQREPENRVDQADRALNRHLLDQHQDQHLYLYQDRQVHQPRILNLSYLTKPVICLSVGFAWLLLSQHFHSMCHRVL